MKKDQREKIQVMTYNWGPCLVKLKVADEESDEGDLS